MKFSTRSASKILALTSVSKNSIIPTRNKLILPIIIILVAGLLAPGKVFAVNPTTAGTPVSPYPTLINLSIEWPITGDDNTNGLVTVRYRKSGTANAGNGPLAGKKIVFAKILISTSMALVSVVLAFISARLLKLVLPILP